MSDSIRDHYDEELQSRGEACGKDPRGRFRHDCNYKNVEVYQEYKDCVAKATLPRKTPVNKTSEDKKSRRLQPHLQNTRKSWVWGDSKATRRQKKREVNVNPMR